MAEIIQIKNTQSEEDGAKAGGYSDAMLSCIFGTKTDEKNIGDQKKVLATIISRKGSTPRGVGTKMLILEDGTTVEYDRRRMYRE